MLQWNKLHEMKKNDEGKRMEVDHQKLVSRMIRSAQGGTWRGRGVQILKEEEEDAKPLARCEEKKKEWAKRWQCDTKVQDLKDKPWRNDELKDLEEDMSRLKESGLEKAARTCKAKTTSGEVVEFLVKVKQCGSLLQQACTMMFFLTPKDVTSERPIARMPTMVRWWEALRAPEVAKWQQKMKWQSQQQTVDIPAPQGRWGEGGGHHGFLPVPNSTAFCGADHRSVDLLARGDVQDFLPGQSSSASSSGLHECADDGIHGVFRTFPRRKKSPMVPSSLSPGVHASVSSSMRALQVRLWAWVMVVSGERLYFWNRFTGETCLELREGYLASWWLRPDGFYVRLEDGMVFETIDDLRME